VYYAPALCFSRNKGNYNQINLEKPMSKSLLMVFMLMVAILLVGCEKSETSTNREATATATQSKPAASPATTTASSTEAIGVTECDTFIAAYEKCVHDKVPEAARAQFNSSLAQWRHSWHDLAKNPQTKATLASVCKTSLDQAKQSMKAYGCTF